MPKYCTIKVGTRNIVLAGCVTGNESIYTYPHIPKCKPVKDACIEVWESAKKALGVLPDLFLPMTHQFLNEDRETALALAQHPELKSRTPCILGGHEHEVFIDQAAGSLIVKVGQDARNIGFVDIWWTATGELRSSCAMLPADEFAAEPQALTFVKKQEGILTEMMDASITQIPTPVSSKDVRNAPSGMASLLLTLTKRALKNEGVELVVINGGNIRGRADYERGPFTMGDLYNELPWDNEQAIVKIPGRVLADSIHASRTVVGPNPGYLHVDNDAEVTDDHRLVKVNQEPLDPSRDYVVSVLVYLLTGMDRVPPLVDWASSNLQIPDIEACKPQKELIMSWCVKLAWRKLLSFDRFDKDHDGHLTASDLRGFLENATQKVDKNSDGYMDKDECLNFLNKSGIQSGFLSKMVNVLDSHNGHQDGMIALSDLAKYIH